MLKDCCVLMCVMINYVLGNGHSEQNNLYGQKIIVYQNPNIISTTNIVKPTSATVGHKPGIPPYWKDPTGPTTTEKQYSHPKKPLYHYESFMNPSKSSTINNMVMESVIESKPLLLKRNFSRLIGVRDPETNPPAVVPVKDCPSCSCGQTFQKVRIVGGIETMVNQYPWMAALLYSNRFYCGASLINNKFLLSAGHCVSFNKDRITAVFLDHDRSTSYETKTIMRKIKNIIRHRGYGTGGNYNNDIALLQLDQEVSLTGMLKPVCLPPTGKSFTGYEGIATGWGATKEHGQTSNKLREVRVPIMSNIDCRNTGYKNRITDNMMCAGYPDGKKDSCQGDSGGPLHILNGTIHQIVGIVSWGEGCAAPNYPGIYTRVNRYVSWIKSNTRDACYC
ncbi:hypothetical protein JTB14_031386 [Gonioctena quinquepunctata]|nr:hypothetical protein JTB14_031386 [Gonioctena quinquepunctata]